MGKYFIDRFANYLDQKLECLGQLTEDSRWPAQLDCAARPVPEVGPADGGAAVLEVAVLHDHSDLSGRQDIEPQVEVAEVHGQVLRSFILQPQGLLLPDEVV